MRFALWATLLGFGAAGCSGDGNGSGDDTDVVPPEPTPYELLPIKQSFQWVDATVNDKRIQYWVPAGPPRGLLFVFHGTNGNFASVTQVEWLEIYNLLVAQNVAIVLSQSLDRSEEVWNTTDTSLSNPDFQELILIRDYLIAETVVEANTPIVGEGFSNGGVFVDLFAGLAEESGWPIATFVSHNSPNYRFASVPAAFVSAENDEFNGQADAVGGAADTCSAETGVTCPHFPGTEIPLDPLRFARLPAYNLVASQEVFDEFVTLAYVDAQGNRLVDVTDVESLMNAYIAMAEAPSPSLPPTQIRVVWATHRVSSQHAREETDWIVSQL